MVGAQATSADRQFMLWFYMINSQKSGVGTTDDYTCSTTLPPDGCTQNPNQLSEGILTLSNCIVALSKRNKAHSCQWDCTISQIKGVDPNNRDNTKKVNNPLFMGQDVTADGFVAYPMNYDPSFDYVCYSCNWQNDPYAMETN